jgi:hypothetical protein
MRENHTSGTVQGVPGNRHSYCDILPQRTCMTTMRCVSTRCLALQGYLREVWGQGSYTTHASNQRETACPQYSAADRLWS